MVAIRKLYPKIGVESTDLTYKSAFDLSSSDTEALVASTSMYSVPASMLTYTAFNLLASNISGSVGAKAGWVKYTIGGVTYRLLSVADS